MTDLPWWVEALLRGHPPGHRRAYGDEMREVVRHRLAAGGNGFAGRWRVTVEVALDLTTSAAWAWGRGMRRDLVATHSGWWLDLRFVSRSLFRNRGYAVTAVLVLAGAVTLNATVFSYVRGTLLHGAPYPDADRVVAVWGSNAADGQLRDVVSGPNYLDLARETTALEALAAFHVDGVTLTGGDRPEVLDAQTATVDFFDVVPVDPYLGRTFEEIDRTSSGPATVLLSYAFWRDRMAADPSVVGTSMAVDGAPHTVIGVLPEGFEFVAPFPLWLPLRDDLLAADERTRIHYHLVGRLAAGASAADATRDLSAILRGIGRRHGGWEGWTVLAEPLHDASVLAVRPALWSIAAAVTLVLLIALVNLATLFRIRTLGRTDELGVRLALGSGRRGVARVLTLEAFVLAALGAATGLLVTPVALNSVRGMLPVWVNIPESAARVPALQALFDPWVMSVSGLLAVAGAVALTAPALAVAPRLSGTAWAGRGSSATRGTRVLVGAQLALATVLCLGAGLTTRGAQRLLATEVGLRDEGLLTLYFGDVWERPYEQQVTYFRQVVERVETVAGVESVGLIDYVPFQGEDDFARVYFLDRSFQPTRDQREEWRRVTDGLFETAGMRMIAGRSFTPDDLLGTPRVAVVNQAFALKHYGERAPIGQFLGTHSEGYRDLEIVGVVEDVRALGPAAPPPPMLYVPLQGEPRGTTGMYVRMSGGVLAAVEEIREAIWSVDSTQPIVQIVPMSELVSTWVAVPRAARSLLGSVAGLALFLSAVGVFGVVAFAVRSRVSEFGVRLALGASPARLRHDVLRRAVPLITVGVGGGVVLGVLAARAGRALLFGVGPLDPVALTVATVLMSLAAVGATYVPARKISKIDPTAAIRRD